MCSAFSPPMMANWPWGKKKIKIFFPLPPMYNKIGQKIRETINKQETGCFIKTANSHANPVPADHQTFSK